MAYKESAEFKTGIPAGNVLPEEQRPLQQDFATDVPAPFRMDSFLAANSATLASGGEVPLFGTNHPDKEFKVMVVGGPSQQPSQSWQHDTWLYQIAGDIKVKVGDEEVSLHEGCCVTIRPDTPFVTTRLPGSIGLVVQVDPNANK
eukprot:1195977-Amphidinium_carterae.1